MIWPWWETVTWWFLPKGLLAFYLAVLMHEVGHALAAHRCGLKVIGLGIGTGKVLIAFPLGSVKCFIGLRDSLGGLTLYASQCPPVGHSRWVAWGGPMAEFLLASTCLGSIQGLGPSEFLVWLFYWSCFGSIVSLLPDAPAGEPSHSTSDGEQLLGRSTLDRESLQRQRDLSLQMLELCKQIGSIPGQIHFLLHAAHESYLLGEPEQANRYLADTRLQHPLRRGFHRCFETYLQNLISPEDLSEQVRKACPDCPELVPLTAAEADQ